MDVVKILTEIDKKRLKVADKKWRKPPVQNYAS